MVSKKWTQGETLISLFLHLYEMLATKYHKRLPKIGSNFPHTMNQFLWIVLQIFEYE